jgi:hypothetical protein
MYLCILYTCILYSVFCVVFCIVNCRPANYLLPPFGGGKPNKKLFHKSHSLVVAICDATMQLLAAPPSPQSKALAVIILDKLSFNEKEMVSNS